MRSETIKVKKPSWVRIVNPEPIAILDLTYRYGEPAMAMPGGVFRIIAEGASRVLAMYQAPFPPRDMHECPSDAMVFCTMEDLLLAAEGVINYCEPYDKRLPERSKGPPADPARIGALGRVPKTRLVRAFFPSIEKIDEKAKDGGPFRERPLVTRVNRVSEHHPIRYGGEMRVIGIDGPMLRVLYRAAAPYRGEQLASGAWFRIPESEFLEMDGAFRQVQAAEALERAIISRLLRSF